MAAIHLRTAAETAVAVRASLDNGNVEAADRLVTELVGRVINATSEIPVGVLAEPMSTGDERYDVLLATGLAYALVMRAGAPEPWMTASPALGTEWLWDGDADTTPEFRAYVRRHTPPLFLAKGILLRDRDFRIA